MGLEKEQKEDHNKFLNKTLESEYKNNKDFLP